MQTSSAAGAALRLADHVRACAVDGQVILLDLRRSKYIGVGVGQSRVLADAIEGWPSCDEAIEGEPGANNVDTLAAPLLAQGLLAPRSSPRSAASTSGGIALPQATRSLHAEDAVPSPRLGWRRLARVLHASSATAFQLRTSSMLSIARAVAVRRIVLEHAPSLPGPLPEAVSAYMKLRLYVFTAHDRCLHDSLTLLRFLAAEHLCARWVVGVRTHPFGAHSWLQTQETVVNDLHEHVRGYRPILVV